jgi:hypothetical protein
VRQGLPATEQPFALACGRTELLRRFCEVRGQVFPTQFQQELERIFGQRDPDRVRQIEALNERIMAHLTDTLFAEAQPPLTRNENEIQLSPRQQMKELLDHLTSRNPYFRLWIAYKDRTSGEVNEENWNDYLQQELGENDADAVEFAKAMAQLDRLLGYFHDRETPLPRYFYERVWFLHFLCEPERMVQTRALLNTLTAEIPQWLSA